jgi:hypothetical protein
MSFSNREGGILLVFAGIGIGVLCGALIGLIAGRRHTAPDGSNVVESVSDLRARAEQVLSELTASVAALEQRDAPEQVETRSDATVTKSWRNGAGEAIG